MLAKLLRIFSGIFLIILVLVLILILMTVRLVDYQFFTAKDYYRRTLAVLPEEGRQLTERRPDILQVGVGAAGITPPVGIPLAGYGDRKGAPSRGVHDSLYTRVIALTSGDRTACIIGYDALLLYPSVARILEDSVQKKFGLAAGQILFTATHTHSGPGGWGQGWVEEQFAGHPDPRVPEILIDSTLAAVQRAFRHIAPANYKTGVIQAPRFIRNRLLGEKGKVDPDLVYMAFIRDNRIIAIFATYSAHATVLSGKNMLYSGDYPGYFERRVESAIGAMVLFAAAGLGSHSYRGEEEGFEKARFVGEGLADSLLAHLNFNESKRSAALTCFRIPIEMPDLQIRITSRLRLASWLASRIIKVRDVYLQFLALDDFFVIGSPAEFSGELALSVKEHASEKGLQVTVTSFNGCYVGYVTPAKYARMSSYETKTMSWFGPYAGDYLAQIMMKAIDLY